MKELNEIEVIDAEIVTTEKNVDRFDNWMKNLGNIFVGNHEKMERAYNLIIE